MELRGKPGKWRATRGWMLLDDQYAKAVAEFEREYPILAAMPVRDGAPQRFVWNQWPAQERGWGSDSGVNDYHPWGIPLPQNNPLWP